MTTGRSHCFADTPIGALRLVAEGGRLTEIDFAGAPRLAAGDGGLAPGDRVLVAAARELAEYFRGERRTFSLPLAPCGTTFQRRVWDALREIPYGETRSYAFLAAHVGRPKAARAVGAANGANPFAIVVPCHRVIGSDGTLTGYAGGLGIKNWLLEHERAGQIGAGTGTL
jgi:methylated-DNA-[protein]-cysteine S-methyltransferase